MFATHINRQRTSFWRSSNDFRIQVGTNEVRAAYSDYVQTVGYESQKFVAVAGGEYALARKRQPDLASPFSAAPHPTTSNAWVIRDERDKAVFEQKTTKGSARIVAEASREDYVFGVSSAEEAIAQYRKKNP